MSGPFFKDYDDWKLDTGFDEDDIEEGPDPDELRERQLDKESDRDLSD
jgi:hypothetical protein